MVHNDGTIIRANETTTNTYTGVMYNEYTVNVILIVSNKSIFLIVGFATSSM